MSVYQPPGTHVGGLRLVDTAEVDWLREGHPDGDMGFLPSGWPAQTWVLHGMWEDPKATDSRTADRRWRDENPEQVGGRFDVGIVAYGSTPFSEPPPAGWRRLWWSELAAQCGAPLGDNHSVPPSSAWFPRGSWPESIRTPPEGTLDRLCGERLISVIAENTADGPASTCFAYYNLLTSPITMQPCVLAGPVHTILDAAHLGSPGWTPTNIWPADRSWLVTTDYDLWGTRVAGPSDLVAAVELDSELETLRFHD